MDQKKLNEIKRYCQIIYSQSKARRHDLEHIRRVKDNALKITKILGMSSIDTYLVEALCYLHDVPICEVSGNTVASHLIMHIFEKHFIKKRIVSLVKQFHLPKKEQVIVTTAIINHPYSTPYLCLHRKSDIYSKILQDADTLDYVSRERQKQFESAHPYLVGPAHLYLSFLRSHMQWFLNYPELAGEFTVS